MAVKPLDEEALFHTARRIASAEDLAQFLHNACGDDAGLAERVRALLEMHEREPSQQDEPGPQTSEYEPIDERAGSQVGPYTLREQIGEGGFGLVFVAEQQQPVRRKVALKVIKPGMDTRAVVARFEAERQALALMDHPNIAKVLDAGATETGRPYFVMELVKGMPITEYADAHNLTPRERLGLFLQVCQAVQHAHQKGVIHRDIKPSNVLVTVIDGVAIPKVIDFGVAKAVGQQLTDKTVYTRFAAMVGTPLYMSPEQAELSGVDVDTRADIYALGVLLYELLTGTTPFDGERFRKAAFDEIRRIIKEEEPPRPSTRLTSLGETLTATAASRGTEPGKLAGVIRGELDWIVMKCLEKDRGRRYETANGLAKDVQRHLSGDAVEACPPTLGYRLRKAYRRNRAAVVTIAAVAAALVVGITGTGIGLLRADHERRLAVQSQQEAMAAAEAEAAQRERAERVIDNTLGLLDEVTSEALGESVFTQLSISTTQQKFYQEVLTYYQNLSRERGNDEPARKRFADAAMRVAKLKRSLGKGKEAIENYEQARKEYEALARDFPGQRDYRRLLAECYYHIGWMRSRLSAVDKALELARTGLSIVEPLVEEFPDDPNCKAALTHCLNLMASCLSKQLELERARDIHERAIGIQLELVAAFPENKEYLNGLFGHQNNIGIAEFEMGHYRKAGDWFQKTGKTAEALYKIDPNERERRYRVAFAKCNLARALLHQWQLDEAERSLRDAIQLYGKLSEEFRNVPDHRFRKAQAENILAQLIWQRGGGAAEADRHFQSVIEAFESLTRDGFSTSLGVRALEWTYRCRGELARHEASDDRGLQQALTWFDKSIDGLETVYRDDPATLMIRRLLSEAHRDRAITHELIGDFDKALADWDRALEVSVPRLEAECQAGRIAARLRKKAITIDQGLAEINELPDPHPQHTAAFEKARFYLIAASLDPANRKDFEDRAMQALGVAYESGNTHLLSLARDREFVPLRARRDFQDLLGRIGIRPATKESPKGGTELP